MSLRCHNLCVRVQFVAYNAAVKRNPATLSVYWSWERDCAAPAPDVRERQSGMERHSAEQKPCTGAKSLSSASNPTQSTGLGAAETSNLCIAAIFATGQCGDPIPDARREHVEALYAELMRRGDLLRNCVPHDPGVNVEEEPDVLLQCAGKSPAVVETVILGTLLALARALARHVDMDAFSSRLGGCVAAGSPPAPETGNDPGPRSRVVEDKLGEWMEARSSLVAAQTARRLGEAAPSSELSETYHTRAAGYGALCLSCALRPSVRVPSCGSADLCCSFGRQPVPARGVTRSCYRRHRWKRHHCGRQ